MGSFAQYIALGFMLNVSDPFNYSARWLLSSRLILDDPRRTYALTLLLVQMHWRNKYFHICICMDVSHYHVLAKGKLDFKVFSCSSIQLKFSGSLQGLVAVGACSFTHRCSRTLTFFPLIFIKKFIYKFAPIRSKRNWIFVI